MKTIKIADITLRRAGAAPGCSVSFKEKLDIAAELDKLGADVIETAPIQNVKADSLLIKTIASMVSRSAISVPVGRAAESVEIAWAAIKQAKRPRLLVSVPVSSVQMEYSCHMKGPQVLELIKNQVKACAELCPDVEFAAEDATRAEWSFLTEAIKAAIAAGAKTVAVCDSAGNMLPDELISFIGRLYADVPELKSITLSAECSDELGMAAAGAISAISAGAGQIKTTVNGNGFPSMEAIAAVFRSKGDDLGVSCGLDMTGLGRTVRRLHRITETEKSQTSAFDNSLSAAGGVDLDGQADIGTVGGELQRLGYDLSGEDLSKVYEAFRRIAEKKPVGAKELDAIVAGAALQVPQTYKLISYVINSGNIITPTASIAVEKEGGAINGLMSGDGPIDAAFLAIEQIVGRHYELEDFQIQAVTEGREAMGSAVVRLRSRGKLFSGHGVSTDIIGAAIRAYVDALNKIEYEEKTDA
jgi:2-isopropylmalate synthase